MIENLIGFKSEYGHYPTRRDFKSKKITPSKNTYYRVFDNIENAIRQVELYEKGELATENEREIKSVRPISKKGEFQCPFCGNWTSGIEKYHSSLTTILKMRFLDLLNSKSRQCCAESMMDCIHAVFGRENPTIRKALALEGYLEKYDQRYSIKEDE